MFGFGLKPRRTTEALKVENNAVTLVSPKDGHGGSMDRDSEPKWEQK